VFVLDVARHAVRAAAALIGESFPTHPAATGGAGLATSWRRSRRSPAPLLATWPAARDRHTILISAYIVLAAVITVACVVALPDVPAQNIDDAAVYSRARWTNPPKNSAVLPRFRSVLTHGPTVSPGMCRAQSHP